MNLTPDGPTEAFGSVARLVDLAWRAFPTDPEWPVLRAKIEQVCREKPYTQPNLDRPGDTRSSSPPWELDGCYRPVPSTRLARCCRCEQYGEVHLYDVNAPRRHFCGVGCATRDAEGRFQLLDRIASKTRRVAQTSIYEGG